MKYFLRLDLDSRENTTSLCEYMEGNPRDLKVINIHPSCRSWTQALDSVLEMTARQAVNRPRPQFFGVGNSDRFNPGFLVVRCILVDKLWNCPSLECSGGAPMGAQAL
jgi:hypothetical protein